MAAKAANCCSAVFWFAASSPKPERMTLGCSDMGKDSGFRVRGLGFTAWVGDAALAMGWGRTTGERQRAKVPPGEQYSFGWVRNESGWFWSGRFLTIVALQGFGIERVSITMPCLRFILGLEEIEGFENGSEQGAQASAE